jgi:hypothetical protein
VCFLLLLIFSYLFTANHEDVKGAHYFELLTEHKSRGTHYRGYHGHNNNSDEKTPIERRKEVLLRRFQIALAKDALAILKQAGT